MRKLPAALGVALAFDLGTFVAASSAASSDYLLKIEIINGECRTAGPCNADNAPAINASGCALIGGVQVKVDGAQMCKVTPPKPPRPKGGLTLSVPLPGSTSSGSSQTPVR